MEREFVEEKGGVCHPNSDQSEEEPDEAPSLCDLPDCLMEGVEPRQLQGGICCDQKEEFEFGHIGSGSQSVLPELCAADDIFHLGQMLPLSRSIDSIWETGLVDFHDTINASVSSATRVHSLTKCESMDHSFLRGLGRLSCTNSSSSCSKSIERSSSISTASSTSDTCLLASHSKPASLKQFKMDHPSPMPQPRHTSACSSSMRSHLTRRNINEKSTFWEFFRLGLVRNPELHDVKHFGPVRRDALSGNNSATSRRTNLSSSSRSASKVHSDDGNSRLDEVGVVKTNGEKKYKKPMKSLLSGCSSAIKAVKPVVSNQTKTRNAGCGRQSNASPPKMFAQGKNQESGKTNVMGTLKKNEEMRMKRHELSRHRTMEWILELPHDSYIDHEPL